MKIVWSDDDAVPTVMREAIKRSTNNARVIVIIDRNGASESDVKDALRDFIEREAKWQLG